MVAVRLHTRLMLVVMAAAVATSPAAIPPAAWVGPLPNFYSDGQCENIGIRTIGLGTCEKLCMAVPRLVLSSSCVRRDAASSSLRDLAAKSSAPHAMRAGARRSIGDLIRAERRPADVSFALAQVN
eukprot:SAG31_NODE_16242_length_717_cov_0.943366_2_plen_126_part_00